MSKIPRNDEQIWNVGNVKNKKKDDNGKTNYMKRMEMCWTLTRWAKCLN
jgi:hypothetical protein